LTKRAWPGSRDLTASSSYVFGSASLIIGFNLTSYFAFNIWLGIAYLCDKFCFLGVKLGEGIFGFRPQPNQFLLFGPQRSLPNFVKIG